MPYVNIRTSAAVSPALADELQKEVGRLISIIPNKTIDNCITQIDGSCQQFVGGKPGSTTFCEVRLFGAAPQENKAQLTKELDSLFTQKLGSSMVYINFIELDEWGIGPDLRQK